MKVNIEHMVISVFIVLAMFGLIGPLSALNVGAQTVEEPDLNGLYGTRGAEEVTEKAEVLVDPTFEEVVEKVNEQERRIVRLELIIVYTKALGAELNDPMAEPEKTSVLSTCLHIGTAVLVVISFVLVASLHWRRRQRT